MPVDVVARARDWLVASDPGSLRLRMAGTTVATLALALAVLTRLTTLSNRPITVALLGVVIAMTSSMAVNDLEPRQRALTMALLPLPATAAVTLGTFLAPHLFAGDAVFVVIMMAAVYVRRFGPRGMALGMVAFISYFFALFLHADIAQLPALAVAVVVGVACSLLMRNVVVRDRPERELARLLRAFRARLGAVVSAAAEGLVGGSLTPRSQRRLQHLLTRLNDAALMVEDRIDDGATGEPARWVFDAELATERLARLTVQVLDLDLPVPAGDRHRLADVLRQLRVALRTERPAGLDDRVRSLAEQLADATPLDGAVVDRLRMAVVAMVRAALATPLSEAALSAPFPRQLRGLGRRPGPSAAVATRRRDEVFPRGPAVRSQFPEAVADGPVGRHHRPLGESLHHRGVAIRAGPHVELIRCDRHRARPRAAASTGTPTSALVLAPGDQQENAHHHGSPNDHLLRCCRSHVPLSAVYAVTIS